MATAESNTLVGVISSLRTSYQTLTSEDLYSKAVQWACFNSTPWMKALGVEAFGIEGMKSVDAFGTAETSGRMIRYDDGVYGIRGNVFATAGTPFFVGRLGNINPELIEGGDEWAYSWHRLIEAQFIPDVDAQDNTKGLVKIKAQKMDGMKQKYVEQISYAILGNSSGPDHNTMGPTAVNTDLPYLISVTQDTSVGAIDPTSNSYWQNGKKAITSIGGGGEMDRPIILRRSLLDMKNDQAKHAEASDGDYLWLCTQGAWQIYDRLMYADQIQGGRGGAFVQNAKYDAAGISHFSFDRNPMIWDAAVTVPYGATASTEAFYGIHIPSYFVSIRREENFLATPWEEPREHDRQRMLVAQIRTRFTPGVNRRRPHCVGYNVPACSD